MKRLFTIIAFFLLVVCGTARLAEAVTINVVTFAGDSIMRGNGASNATATVLARLVCLHPAWEIRNYSYDGASMAGSSPMSANNIANLTDAFPGVTAKTVVVFLGTNDWSGNVALSTFDTAYSSFLTTVKGSADSPTVVCVTPIWRTDEGTLNSAGTPYTIATLRSHITTDCTNAGLSTIDGLTLVPNTAADYIADGIHPNDTGYYNYSVNLNTALGALVSP